MNANTKLKAIQAVEQSVRVAFAGVTLEDGVGLMQGLEIDSYAGADAEAAALPESNLQFEGKTIRASVDG